MHKNFTIPPTNKQQLNSSTIPLFAACKGSPEWNFDEDELQEIGLDPDANNPDLDAPGDDDLTVNKCLLYGPSTTSFTMLLLSSAYCVTARAYSHFVQLAAT